MATGGGIDSGEAIAVVGMACRSPAPLTSNGGDLLRDGVEAASETLDERYDAKPPALDRTQRGRVLSTRSGYLRDVNGFGAALFGLSDAEVRT